MNTRNNNCDVFITQLLEFQMASDRSSLLIFNDEYAKRTTLEQYNKELDEAVARIEQGKFVSHKDALKELSEW